MRTPVGSLLLLARQDRSPQARRETVDLSSAGGEATVRVFSGDHRVILQVPSVPGEGATFRATLPSLGA